MFLSILVCNTCTVAASKRCGVRRIELNLATVAPRKSRAFYLYFSLFLYEKTITYDPDAPKLDHGNDEASH